MFRISATLAFMAGFDLFLFDGKYTHAAEWMALSILQRF
jgi:hypothetical protein